MLNHLSRKLSLLVLASVLALSLSLAVAPHALASSAIDQTTYVIEKDATKNGNVYLNAGDIIVDGTLEGDLVAVANSIVVNGKITGSLIAASPRITINGEIGQSVRTLSQDLVINGTVGGDVTSASDSLLLAKDAVVADSLYAAGNTITVSGKVAGVVRTALSDQLPTPTAAERSYAIAMGFLSLALLGLVIYSLEPQEQSVLRNQQLKERFLRYTLAGLGSVILVPILSILLLISSIGRPLGMLLLFGLMAYGILAIVDAAHFLGKLLIFRADLGQRYNIGVFLLGALVFTALFHLPILALIPVILVLAALGVRLTQLKHGMSASLFRSKHG